jgi:hypothetical protein
MKLPLNRSYLNGHVRLSNTRRQQNDLMGVLRRPVEPAFPKGRKTTLKRHSSVFLGRQELGAR